VCSSLYRKHSRKHEIKPGLLAKTNSVADLPTPKSEKTGGGPKQIWRLGKKPGGFGKMSHDLII